MQNDGCLEMFAMSKDKPYHIEATARDQHNVSSTLRFEG